MKRTIGNIMSILSAIAALFTAIAAVWDVIEFRVIPLFGKKDEE